MAIELRAKPETLTWEHFQPRDRIVDKRDGLEYDAYSAFKYEIPYQPFRTYGRSYLLATDLKIYISPKCSVRRDATRTEALLNHEQFHYNVGRVTGRALAHHLMTIRAENKASLRKMLNEDTHYYFKTLANKINRSFDQETQHGTNAAAERRWQLMMHNLLHNPRMGRLGRFDLSYPGRKQIASLSRVTTHHQAANRIIA